MKIPKTTITSLLLVFLATAFLTSAVVAPVPAAGNPNELSYAPAGRSLPIATSPGTNVHLLDVNDHITLRLTFFNSDTVARWVDVCWNAQSMRVNIPAGEYRLIGPWRISGRAKDNTAVGNLNQYCVAEVNDKIVVIGQFTTGPQG